VRGLFGAQTGETMKPMPVEMFGQKKSYSQRRRHTRVPANFAVHVRTTGLRMADQARDISESGVGVATEKPLAPMTLVTLQLELPHNHGAVDVLGRVMWRTDDAMGLRFEQPDPQVLQLVERLRKELTAL